MPFELLQPPVQTGKQATAIVQLLAAAQYFFITFSPSWSKFSFAQLRPKMQQASCLRNQTTLPGLATWAEKYKFHDHQQLHFVSFATINWIDVFVRRVYCDIVVNSRVCCPLLP
jgi:hypothetical protein